MNIKLLEKCYRYLRNTPVDKLRLSPDDHEELSDDEKRIECTMSDTACVAINILADALLKFMPEYMQHGGRGDHDFGKNFHKWEDESVLKGRNYCMPAHFSVPVIDQNTSFNHCFSFQLSRFLKSVKQYVLTPLNEILAQK